MTAPVTIAACVVSGLAVVWSLDRDREGPTGVPALLWGVLAMGAWLWVTDLGGVRWSGWLTLAPGAVGLTVVVARRAVRARVVRTEGWAVLAGVVALAHAGLLATHPVFGWDFRYNWGLKARVFCAVGAHDATWLSWPGHAFAHPDYPPLWPDLLTAAGSLGGDPGVAGAWWAAVLALGLAAVCWRAAAPAAPPVRFVAAAVGGWAPVILAPTASTSGYAEPLLAFLAGVGLCALADPQIWGRAARSVVVGAVIGLALTKNEGAALAVGVGLAWWLRRRDLAPLSAALLAQALWRIWLLAHGVTGEAVVLAPARALGRLAELPAAVADVVGPTLGLVAVLWVLLLISIGGRALRPVRLSLAVWGLAVLAAYLVSPHDLRWHLATSLERVIAVPLPVVLALGLGRAWRAPRPAVHGSVHVHGPSA